MGLSALPALSLQPVNAQVFSVHRPDGAHVGNLKHIGAVWKVKAVGYDPDGSVVPGGGPFTERHNTELAAPDAAALCAALNAPA